MATPSVQKLSSQVVDQIAAGEVVERPASLAKELIENAIDARASMVQVHLEDGGLSCLAVTDDGHGMRPEDAERAILRHATSKLRTAADLSAIRSLGFRGEALSSICSIARVTLTTRPADSAEGFRLVVHGGQVVQAGAAGCPVGTTVQVRDLFYNTPARRKFMRAPATEQAHVVEAGLRVALGVGRVGLVVTAGTRRLLDIPEVEGQGDAHASAQAQRRVSCALGHRVGALTPVYAAEDGITVQGYLSAPQLARSDTRGLWLFVNGRFVRDRMLQRAVLDAYQACRPGGFATAVLWLQLDPQGVDVNVHPQKLEVRFVDAHAVYRALGAAIVQALGSVPQPAAQLWVQTSDTQRGWGRSANVPQAAPLGASRIGAETQQRGAVPPVARPADAVATARSDGQAAAEAPKWAAVHRVSHGQSALNVRGAGAGGRPADRAAVRVRAATLRYVSGEARSVVQPVLPLAGVDTPRRKQGDAPAAGTGCTFAQLTPIALDLPAFMLAHGAGNLVAIDVAAAARHLAEAALAQQRHAGGLVPHRLVLPPTFVARPSWAERLAKQHSQLQAWALELDQVGPTHYAIRAIPAALQALCPEAVTQACLDVVLHLGEVQDMSALQRAVDARWLNLVGEAACSDVSTHAALWQALRACALSLDAAPFARCIGQLQLAQLFA